MRFLLCLLTLSAIALGGVLADPTFTAEERNYWAFRKIAHPALPAVRNIPAASANPIDRFIVAKLQAKGLDLSAPADKITLLRRVTFDLTGLPPTPEETEAFVNDSSPKAYEKVVDRLLASPRY